jgi:hypothetical protein
MYTEELAEAIFIDETGQARREVIEYQVRRGRKGKKSTIEYFCFQAGRSAENQDQFGHIEHKRTIAFTDPQVREWLESHAKAGDITEDFRRECMTEVMDEYI